MEMLAPRTEVRNIHLEHKGKQLWKTQARTEIKWA